MDEHEATTSTATTPSSSKQHTLHLQLDRGDMPFMHSSPELTLDPLALLIREQEQASKDPNLSAAGFGNILAPDIRSTLYQSPRDARKLMKRTRGVTSLEKLLLSELGDIKIQIQTDAELSRSILDPNRPGRSGQPPTAAPEQKKTRRALLRRCNAFSDSFEEPPISIICKNSQSTTPVEAGPSIVAASEVRVQLCEEGGVLYHKLVPTHKKSPSSLYSPTTSEDSPTDKAEITSLPGLSHHPTESRKKKDPSRRRIRSTKESN